MALHSMRVATIGAVLAAMFLVAGAGADDKEFELAVWTIRATKSNSDISTELKPIAKELKERYKFTGFKLEKKATEKKKEGAAYSVDLIGGYKVKLTATGRDGERVKLKLELSKKEGDKEKKLTSTSFTIKKGKFQLVGGGKIDEKGEDELIVGVSGR